LQPINYGIDCEYWFPVFSQNVQTYIAFQVNVRMVHWSFTFYFRRFMWIIWPNFEAKNETSSSVKALKLTKTFIKKGMKSSI
jgi:hypothetical protein